MRAVHRTPCGAHGYTCFSIRDISPFARAHDFGIGRKCDTHSQPWDLVGSNAASLIA
jgi:hypothetical protein